MKSDKDIIGSGKAALKSAKKNLKRIEFCLEDIKGPDDLKDTMPLLREYLANLNKAIHEFNAYSNCVKDSI